MELKSLFDQYTLNARVKPVFVLFFPLLVSIMVWFPETRDSYKTIISLLATFGILTFFSNIFASIGRKKEPSVFKKIGGNPAALLLRHSNTTIDSITKKRYHTFLEKKMSVSFPSSLEESNDINLADSVYDSGIRYLRNYSRDTKKYPLVFKENMNYGFARNLYCSKLIGILICVLSLLLSVLMFYLKYIANNNFPKYTESISKLDSLISIISSFSMILIWVFLVNFNWVKERAFAYGRALLEVCEKK